MKKAILTGIFVGAILHLLKPKQLKTKTTVFPIENSSPLSSRSFSPLLLIECLDVRYKKGGVHNKKSPTNIHE